MAEASPDDLEWLSALVDRSALLPEEGLRSHWKLLIKWLSPAERYTLAAILLEIEHACTD